MVDDKVYRGCDLAFILMGHVGRLTALRMPTYQVSTSRSSFRLGSGCFLCIAVFAILFRLLFAYIALA
jgi:hypothetical protein